MKIEKEHKPIDNVTVDRLQVVMSGIGLNFTDKELDVLIDAVELIEDNAGSVTLDNILELKNNHYGEE